MVPAAAGRRLDPGTFQSAEFQSIPGNAGLRGGASRLSTGGDAQASAAETSPGVYAAIGMKSVRPPCVGFVRVRRRLNHAHWQRIARAERSLRDHI